MQILDAEEFERLDVVGMTASPFRSGLPEIVEVLDALSKEILGSRSSKQFPDLATFGFFCRKSNVERYLEGFRDLDHRFGLGALVHVAPGNIPMNFAFSLVMGLVAGNQNYVRLPSSSFAQVEVALGAIRSVFEDREFADLASRVVLFRSERDSLNFRELVLRSDGIVVWGGDETVAKMRSLPKGPLAREIYFASRSSFAIMDAAAVLGLSEASLSKHVAGFFNDTYLVDQAACSSPSAVFWLGGEKTVQSAQNVFWAALENFVRREWSSWAPTGVRKLSDLFSFVVNAKSAIDIQFKSNALWLTSDSRALESPLRYGYFFETRVSSVAEVLPHLRENEQTVTYFGGTAEKILGDLCRANSARIERICRVGRALDMGFVWDGKDSLPLMSRLVAVE